MLATRKRLMNFANDVRRGLFFNNNYIRAEANRAMTVHCISKPYYNAQAHLSAFIYPALHLAQLMRNLGYFAYGACVLVASLIEGRTGAAARTRYALWVLTKAIVIELLNIVRSIISLVTRLVATLIHGGYSQPVLLESSPDSGFFDTIAMTLRNAGSLMTDAAVAAEDRAADHLACTLI
jgi:hypothetical protein